MIQKTPAEQDISSIFEKFLQLSMLLLLLSGISCPVTLGSRSVGHAGGPVSNQGAARTPKVWVCLPHKVFTERFNSNGPRLSSSVCGRTAFAQATARRRARTFEEPPRELRQWLTKVVTLMAGKAATSEPFTTATGAPSTQFSEAVVT